MLRLVAVGRWLRGRKGGNPDCPVSSGEQMAEATKRSKTMRCFHTSTSGDPQMNHPQPSTLSLFFVFQDETHRREDGSGSNACVKLDVLIFLLFISLGNDFARLRTRPRL